MPGRYDSLSATGHYPVAVGLNCVRARNRRAHQAHMAVEIFRETNNFVADA
jgi:hypothetical protein